MNMKRVLINILIAIDQLVNTLFGGWADETISARSWRLDGTARRWSIARRVIDGLFFFQKDHCMNAYNSEMLRMQIAPEYRAPFAHPHSGQIQ